MNDIVTDELREIYADAARNDIFIIEWSGHLAAAGDMASLRQIEEEMHKEGALLETEELDPYSHLALGDFVNFTLPGSGATREEACRNAVNAWRSYKRNQG